MRNESFTPSDAAIGQVVPAPARRHAWPWIVVCLAAAACRPISPPGHLPVTSDGTGGAAGGPPATDGGNEGQGAQALGPPTPPRVPLDCPDGVAGLHLWPFPEVPGYHPGIEVLEWPYALSGIGAGSSDIDLLVRLDTPVSAVTAVGVNGRTIAWAPPVLWNGLVDTWTVLVPAEELTAPGQARLEAIADGHCVYADIPIVAGGPLRAALHVTPTELPLAADRDAVSLADSNADSVDAGDTMKTSVVLWRDITHFGEPPWAPVLTGTTGPAWIYQMSSLVDPAHAGTVISVASNWVPVRIVGIDPIPDIIAASPQVLPLGAPDGSMVSITLSARDHFSSFTQIRAGHDASDQQTVGFCGAYAPTCRVQVPTSLLSTASPLLWVATTPGVGDGSALTVPVENPTPNVFVPAESVTVSATQDQIISIYGDGIVATGDASQRSFVEEVTTGTRLASRVDSLRLAVAVPPALVTRTGPLQVHVVNPGTGSGPPLVSRTLTVNVVAAPWIAEMVPATLTGNATSFPVSLRGTNLDPAADITQVGIEIVAPEDAPPLIPPDVGHVLYLSPTARSGDSWSAEFPARYVSSAYAGTWTAQIRIGGTELKTSNVVRFEIR